MAFVGDPLSIDVQWAGKVALVKVSNRQGHLVELRVSGPDLGDRIMRVLGNDALSAAYTVTEGETLTICHVGDSADAKPLYEGTTPQET